MRAVFTAALAVIAVCTLSPGLQAQAYSNNPYRPVPWPKPWQPDGLQGSIDFGPTSAVFADPNEDALWVATRCGRTPNYHTSQEGCVFKPDYDMIFKFDLEGNLVSRFGAGLVAGAHAMYVDRQGNVWVADEGGGAEYGHEGAEVDAEMMRRGIGMSVVKFNPQGQVIQVIGERGVPGGDNGHLNHPSSVAIALDGTIYVADSHGGNPNRRIMRFTPQGQFVNQIGCVACGQARVENTQWGRFSDVHQMAIDAQGRVFAADKGNYRIQIFNPDLTLADVWLNWGQGAGVAIDPESQIMVTADVESSNNPPFDGTPNNQGVEQGLYVGSARTGWVKAFILAAAPPITGGDGGPEGVAIDRYGNIYWGETRSALDIRRSQHIMKYVDITRTPSATCEWWGYTSERAGRGSVGCGIDRESRQEFPNIDP
jgi:sugar lactone lactonase YvrE